MVENRARPMFGLEGKRRFAIQLRMRSLLGGVKGIMGREDEGKEKEVCRSSELAIMC